MILGDEMGLGKTIQVIALLADNPGMGNPLWWSHQQHYSSWQREIKGLFPEIGLMVIKDINVQALQMNLEL